MPELDRRRRDERAATGDHEAWEQIYRSVYPPLRAFVARRVHARAIEDVVSETMTRAVAGIVGYRPSTAGVEGWIFGIARHVVADYHRRVGRERRRPVIAADPHDVALPGDAVLVADEHALLRSRFEQLSERDREVLELRFVAELSTEETAEALGRRPGAIRTAQSRALERLRQLMDLDR